jgi:hypothetical protein
MLADSMSCKNVVESRDSLMTAALMLAPDLAFLASSSLALAF